MLDKNVPNPLAKNPNIYTHKVFASIGIILIVTILAAAGVWYYVENQSGTKDTTEQVTETKVATSSAKTETKTEEKRNETTSSKKDETAAWKTYSSKEMGYSIKYPDTLKVLGDSLNDSSVNGFYSETSFQSPGLDYIDFSVEQDAGTLGKGDYDNINSYEIGKEVVKELRAGLTLTYTRLENTKIDGEVAIKQVWETNNSGVLNYGYEIMIKHGNSYYRIRNMSRTKIKFENDKATLDLMSSTFKFL